MMEDTAEQCIPAVEGSSQVLVHFDPSLEICLACDASDYGISAILSHLMLDGTEKPVGFNSRLAH